MNQTLLYLVITLLFAMFLTLGRFILFKYELYKLKQEMNEHYRKHGADDQLWVMFATKTNKMLSFWS